MAFVPAKNTRGRGIDATPRGSTRWERAARNALQHPHSAAAKVYRSRYELALIVSDARRAMGDSDGPWQFMGPRSSQVGGEHTTKRARVYATCSTFCTVMQVQLDFGKRDLPGVSSVFLLEADENRPWMRTVEPLNLKTLKRQMHCYVCTGVIGRK